MLVHRRFAPLFRDSKTVRGWANGAKFPFPRLSAGSKSAASFQVEINVLLETGQRVFRSHPSCFQILSTGCDTFQILVFSLQWPLYLLNLTCNSPDPLPAAGDVMIDSKREKRA
ncbi:hypothetical protein GGR38_004129 [Novosphingobium sediminicola]|uniref:Uncharacterized protein n=1 Tax=Novosphingobium sediminicola TaxID=563162 RepID=A0A7W6CNS2_9SPHN|nr:hypothetical protein [Novosphingobium sediminicola]